MLGHANTKALTTPVALILALMMVVAASTSLLFWVTKLEAQEQGSVESSQTKLSDSMSSCISLPQFDFNVIDNTSSAIIKNCGNRQLIVGDSAIQDNGVVSSQPCSFVMNSSTCDVCPFTINPSVAKSFKIYWNGTNCLSQITKGQKHQITLYVDKLASATKAFVPKSIVECGVSVANITPLEQSIVAPAQNIINNITVTNKGNVRDTFLLTNSTVATAVGTCTDSPTFCNGSRVVCTIYNENWTNISSVVLEASASAYVYFNTTGPGGSVNYCNTTLTAKSLNCESKKAALTVSTLKP